MTRGIFFSRISRSNALRTTGELARSISPITSKIVVFSRYRAEICTGRLLIYPSANKLNHAKPVGRTDPFVDNRVHALSHEMESKDRKSTRLNSSHRTIS